MILLNQFPLVLTLLLPLCFFFKVVKTETKEEEILQNFDGIIDNYFKPYLNYNKIIKEEHIDNLYNENVKCLEFQRVLISQGRAIFLGDPRCNNKFDKDKRNALRLQKKKKKFVGMFQIHFDKLAQLCQDSIQYVDIIVNLRDEPYLLLSEMINSGSSSSSSSSNSSSSSSSGNTIAPLFSFQTTKDYLDIPIEYSMDAFDDSLKKFINNYTEYAALYPEQYSWDQKVNVLFWRGTHTGGMYNRTNWKSYARSKISLYSKRFPKEVDAGFNRYTQVFPRAIKAMNREIGLKKYVDMSMQYKYKYLASIDGNGWANRLPFLMSLGSVVVKQDSPYSTWWYPLLKPDRHFKTIPRSMEFKDIKRTLNYLHENDEIIRRIASQGMEFVKTYVMDEASTGRYMCRLLKKYQDLIDYSTSSDTGSSTGISSSDLELRVDRLVKKYGTSHRFHADGSIALEYKPMLAGI